ncbi:MAG TPA: glycosyltransferase family 4 protein [Myxococcota bacterium]|nr:glycosyltransferase family 4 protein [Myxococcota bacterium]
MKILDVSPRFDAVPGRGSDARIHGVLAQLSRRHSVRQFSQGTWEDLHRQARSRTIRHSPTWEQWQWVHPLAAAVGAVPVRAWPTAPLWAGRALSLARPRRLDAWLRWADVVLVEFPWQLGYCVRRHPAGRYVYASMNVEAQKFRSWARAAGVDPAGDRWLRWVERLEADAVRRAERVLAVSADDAALFVERYGCSEKKIVVVENGADTTRLRPASAAERAEAGARLGLPLEGPTVLFAGAAVPPNRAGLEWVRRVAAHAPELGFVAVGAVSEPRGVEGNLVRLGFVPDFRSALHAADLGIVPIEHGGGTKIKLLESVAAGLPTVVFADCLAGLELPVVVAEKDPRAVASALRALVREPDRAARLAEAGRAAVVRRYDWSVTTAPLERLLARLGPA